MAEQSGFFPDVSGDRSYTADFLAKWIAAIIGNGVYDGDLAVAAGSNMQITVPSGRAWINGYHYRNDAALTLTIANADGVLNRKDTVVLRWDVNARSITAQVLQGTPASSPTAPSTVRTAEQYDLKLAEISIPAGTTAITQVLITDTRLDNSVCGIVTGVVKQVDTTALYNQIQSDLAGFKATNEAGFTTWFNGIKDILDSSTAGNLLNLINNHKADATVHITQLACTTSGTVHALTGLSATSGIAPCVFKTDAAYAVGDTFTVGGTAYSVVTSGGEALRAGAFLRGDIVGVKLDIDAKKLYIRQDSAAQVGAVRELGEITQTILDNPTIGYSYTGSVGPDLAGLPLNQWGIIRCEASGILSHQIVSYTSASYERFGFNTFDAWTKVGDGCHASSADYASGSVALTTPAVRNIQATGTQASSYLGLGVINVVIS